MKHKNYLLYFGLTLVLFGCTSAPRPMAVKSDHRISFSTEMALGESFTFYTDAPEKERDSVWLDRNNNGVQDVGEKITNFGYKDKCTFPLESQQMTLYGKVTDFGCSKNKLVTLDVHENPALEYLICWQNNLKNLNLQTNTRLKYLICYRNQLHSLDVSANTALEELWCDYNYITILDVSKNTELTQLRCSLNGLTALDVSHNKNLKKLVCGCNHLTALDVRVHTQLELLDCAANELTELDVSRNRQLKDLMCAANRLTNLNLHNNPKLETLECGDNRFTTLDVSANPDLHDIECTKNKLAGKSMETFIQSIPPCSSNKGGKLVVIDTSTNDKNVCTAAHVNAMKAKNWTVYSLHLVEGYAVYAGSDADTAENRNR